MPPGDSSIHTLGTQDNGKTVSVGVDEEVHIELPEQATAGYRWKVVTDAGPACRLIEDSRSAPAGRTGGTGTHQWRLRAAQPGLSVFRASYARSFGASEADSEFSAHINVRGPG